MKRCLIYLFAFLFWAPPAFSQVVAPEWGHLSALPDARNGRYDDMDFVTASRGWVVNLSGEIWHTEDAGASWDLQLVQTSSAWRSVAFLHELGPRGLQIGWAGTVFSPTSVLWETRDGGEHWVDITHRIQGVIPAGICGMVTVNDSAWGVGAYHGSPTIVWTTDRGLHWIGMDVKSLAGALIDVYFQDEMVGVAVGGSCSSLDGDAVVLRTEDGGSSWTKVFQSQRDPSISGEWGWKISFPTPLIGYVSVEYRSNPNSNDAKVLKTTDGGKTWHELAVRGSKSNLGLQGIGFISPEVCWASGRGVTSVTLDGGETWEQLVHLSSQNPNGQLDGAMNRFFMVNDTLAYGVGSRLYELSGFGAQATYREDTELPKTFDLETSFPNPFSESTTLMYSLDAPARVSLRVIDPTGRMHRSYHAEFQDPGEHQYVWDGRNDAGQKLASGNYIFLIDIGSSIEMKQVVLLK